MAYYYPHMILNQRNWDYKKHFQYEFGLYVQASQLNKATNANLARNVDAIYLLPTTNLQGVHKLMDLSTRILISQPKVYTCVMTKIFIKAVEKLAEYQGFKTLRFCIARRKKFFFLMMICSQECTGYIMTTTKDDIREDENQ